MKVSPKNTGESFPIFFQGRDMFRDVFGDVFGDVFSDTGGNIPIQIGSKLVKPSEGHLWKP